MVAVSDKDLLSWYLITVKLKETVEASLENTPRSIGSPRPPQQQQQQPQPSELPQVGGINGEIEKHEFVQSQANITRESEWMISIRENLEHARRHELTSSWSKLCIYRVPHILRELVDHKAYIPQVVSLGPYYHGRRALRKMEPHKWRGLRCMLNRTHQDINLYLDSMKELEEKARACYEQPVSLCSDKFVEIMVLDGCFVLELFRGVEKGFPALGYDKNDPVFGARVTMHSIQRDMIMLENQIPLFVLDRLLSLQLDKPDQKRFVSRLALEFLDPLIPTETLTVSDRNKPKSSLSHVDFAFHPLPDQEALHCLDVFRNSLLLKRAPPAPEIWFKREPPTNTVADKRQQRLVHCAIDLKNAGIKFEERQTHRFCDIEFENGVLKIPRLLVHDGTKPLFFNLVAFEQCHPYCTKNITSYLTFMDNFINSAEDVAYLHSHGIIAHWLENDTEVANLFNKICQEVVFDRDHSYLLKLHKDVKEHYDKRWHHWLTMLKYKYFNSPWAVISFIAAVLLLSLTSLQSFYGVYGYYRPSS
ncbi:hypothetical protein Nepgr_008241 [Nepenthes gracilis]|uniref:Uncharacterized protein n=1 Tax=Nepenthes gracilis TaxID=150966 RepID=A0AAD3S8P7_NEPGR|nr:hypothetical protein Nepgr_008241 [Nepenthes gracilis]